MDVQTIRRYTDKPIDCHLMIENPANKVDWFIKAGAEVIQNLSETGADGFILGTSGALRRIDSGSSRLKLFLRAD